MRGTEVLGAGSRINGMDHPRVCGEQGELRPGRRHLLGSPPRVRGTAYAANERYAVAGITPACAGNSHKHDRRCAVKKDHPRVCGEQHLELLDFGLYTGSPPRVRGTD